jgi:hypothetical protein
VPANVQYLQEGTGHATQQDIVSKWGEPSDKQVHAAGEIWEYRFQRFDSMEHPIGCEGFMLHFDEAKILRRWSELDC